jgi:hypothetical protein
MDARTALPEPAELACLRLPNGFPDAHKANCWTPKSPR